MECLGHTFGVMVRKILLGYVQRAGRHRRDDKSAIMRTETITTTRYLWLPPSTVVVTVDTRAIYAV